jgi:hypothetical protein
MERKAEEHRRLHEARTDELEKRLQKERDANRATRHKLKEQLAALEERARKSWQQPWQQRRQLPIVGYPVRAPVKAPVRANHRRK